MEAWKKIFGGKGPPSKKEPPNRGAKGGKVSYHKLSKYYLLDYDIPTFSLIGYLSRLRIKMFFKIYFLIYWKT